MSYENVGLTNQQVRFLSARRKKGKDDLITLAKAKHSFVIVDVPPTPGNSAAVVTLSREEYFKAEVMLSISCTAAEQALLLEMTAAAYATRSPGKGKRNSTK